MSTSKTKLVEEKLSSALHALKHHNFKIFLGGQLVSVIGNYIQTVAQAWLVYRLTGSATLLGLARLWQVNLDERELFDIAAGLGSDVPLFLIGGTVLGVGRGEEVYP